jgi:hypothetical protein
MAWDITGNAGTNPANNFLGTTDNQPLVIKTNGGEAARVDTHHNVGIGTTTPGARLTVDVANEGDLALRLMSGPNAFLDITPTNVGGRFQTVLNTLNNRDVVILTGTGNVGIGTTNPDRPLVIQAQGTSQELISFKDPTGATKWHINQDLGGLPGLNFVETGVADARLFLKAGGNVGIGTPNPESTVHLAPHAGSPNEEVWIEASDPGSGVTAFTRLRAVTSNGVRESQILFGGECSFVWLPSRDGTGGQQAKNTLTLLVNTDPAGNVTARLAQFDSDVVLRNDQGGETIRLDRQAGDIILQNADCAEDFEIGDCGMADPGSVMVLGDDGKLHISTQAYDRRVAGVVSGAGPNKPGLVLDRQRSARDRLPISLVGKAFCKVDAQYAPVAVGDLLTSSSTPGHAMRAEDPLKAFGAVIGKALRPLQVGQGMIPILIALQ